LLFSAVTDFGQALEEEVILRLLTIPATIRQPTEPSQEITRALDALTRERQDKVRRSISERNARFFETEAEKLEGWQ